MLTPPPSFRNAVSPRLSCHCLLSLLLLGLSVGTVGCHRGPDPSTAGGQRALTAERQQEEEQVRQQLGAIPPPVKSKFMTVKSLDTWENPYLTVQENVIILHVTLADANTSALGEGGMLRPTNARRQNLTIRIGELPAALNAVPATAWPYGRVVAVEEAHGTPKSAEPQVRRNMEQAMKTLTQLGVVMYEWGEGGPGLR